MIVNVTFPVQMFVKVDTVTGALIQTIVQTPNVSSMSELGHHLDVQTEDYMTIYDDAIIAEAILILDNNCWPEPEMVA